MTHKHHTGWKKRERKERVDKEAVRGAEAIITMDIGSIGEAGSLSAGVAAPASRQAERGANKRR